jgi:tetratricopeptide (TPR) repeat protein
MTAHFQRGVVLYQQGRHDEAIAEFQRHLLESPDDAMVHALISHCLTELGKPQEASDHAQKAIALAPESAIGFRALGRSMLARNRLREAQAAIEEGLRLDPEDAETWALLSQSHLMNRDWRKALEAADRGLTIEPDHTACTNLRAQSLVQLGDRKAAAATMDVALALDPDDSWTHANQGWSLLHANDPKKAMEHFREALRLDPMNDWAKAGIVEAMQARNIIYRYLLRYFLWAGRLPASWQWGLVLGGYLGNRMLNQLAESVPAVAPFVYPIIGLYLAFAVLTWLGPSLFNLLLRFNRFGRHALSQDQVRGANLLAIGFLPTLAMLILGVLLWEQYPFLIALFWFLTLLPTSVIYRCEAGWPRTVMALAVGWLVFMDLLITLPLLGDLQLLPGGAVKGLIVVAAIGSMKLFFYVFLGLQFLAQYLATVRVRS